MEGVKAVVKKKLLSVVNSPKNMLSPVVSPTPNSKKYMESF
jgi:hypothetical protein